MLTDDDLSKDNLRIGGFFNTMLRDIIPTSDVGANAYQRAQNLTADVFSGFLAPSGAWNGGNNNATYNLYYHDWNNVAFDNAYTKIMTPWLEISKYTEDFPAVRAIADIAKVLGMHRVSDIYGPIPYSQFGKSSIGNPYDSQKDVYNQFIEELNKAIDDLTSFVLNNPGVTLLENYDLIYGGNTTKWVKLGNSLKLRLAMRMSYVNPKLAKTLAEEAVNHAIGVFTTADESAYLGSNKAAGIIYHPLDVLANRQQETKMSATMESYLKGLKDPRIGSYFTKVQNGEYNGLRIGIPIYAQIEKGSTAVVDKSDMVKIMATSEVFFLRAEGALNGWNMQGAAEELYNQGIKTSFEEADMFTSSSVKVLSQVDEYINDRESKPIDYIDNITYGYSFKATSDVTVKWNESDSKERKLEKIITQKWISLFPEGQEAWSEFRRTGYPKLFPVAVNNSGGTIDTKKQIRRVVFPKNEYDNNKIEVEKAIKLLESSEGDTGGVQLWWDTKY